MLKIFRQQLPVQLNETQCRDLGVRLAPKFSPLIAGVKREYWNKVGLQPQPEDAWTLFEGVGSQDRPLNGGDLYLVDPDTILYFKFPREQSLEAGVITRKDPASYHEFFSSIRSLLSSIVGGFSGEWEPVGRLSAAHDGGQTLQGTETLHPTSQEVEAAQELENETSRDLLDHIIQKSSVFLNKLSEGRDKVATEKLVSRFDKLQMITRDYAVLCSKTGQQILRVASRAAIEDPSHKNFKCYICGKAINEETVDEIITASDFGKKLIADDYWLLVRVIGAMRQMGLSEEELSLQRDDDGLINLSVTINQEAYMFVLATHKLSLNDAYLISAHVAADALDHVVVVSNEKVSSLMRFHLEKSNPGTSFDVVDSLRGIEEKFETILKDKEKKSLRQCLEAFSTLTPIRVQDLIMQRIAPDAQYLPEQLAETRAEVTSHPPLPAPEVEPATENGSARQEMGEDESAVPDDEPYYIEEVLPEEEDSEETV